MEAYLVVEVVFLKLVNNMIYIWEQFSVIPLLTYMVVILVAMSMAEELKVDYIKIITIKTM